MDDPVECRYNEPGPSFSDWRCSMQWTHGHCQCTYRVTLPVPPAPPSCPHHDLHRQHSAAPRSKETWLPLVYLQVPQAMANQVHCIHCSTHRTASCLLHCTYTASYTLHCSPHACVTAAYIASLRRSWTCDIDCGAKCMMNGKWTCCWMGLEYVKMRADELGAEVCTSPCPATSDIHLTCGRMCILA